MLRLPILYGDVETVLESAVTILNNNLLDSTEQYIDDWAIRSLTSTEDVATALAQMIMLQSSGSTLLIQTKVPLKAGIERALLQSPSVMVMLKQKNEYNKKE